MDDKTMLEGALWDLKVLGDLCLHGCIESGTSLVHDVFEKSLHDVLSLQNELYLCMSSLGMYSVSNAPSSKIEKTLAKFTSNLDC